MDSMSLSIIISTFAGGAVLGIKKTRDEFKKLRKSAGDVNEEIKILNDISSNYFKKTAFSLFRTGVAVSSITKPAIEFESAMADVKKVVDFDTPKQFEEMQSDILKLTRSLPLASSELAEIAASGGQLGVAREDITSFTTTIAKMSTAFDMGAGESGDAMAKLANVYKIPIKEIDKLGDAINHLSDSTPAKARDIVNTLGRVGGLAKQFGLTEIQAASLSGAFIALGKTPETAATAMKSMMMTLSTADKAGGKVAKGINRLGLSTKELKANIAKDSEAAILDILRRINHMPKEAQTGILVDIFGRQFAGDVATLAGGIDTYRDSINLLNKTDASGNFEYLGSMGREFDVRAKTTENNIQLLKNSITEISVALGSILLPAVNSIINEIKPFIYSITNFVKENKEAVTWAFKFGAALLALRTGFLFTGSIGFKFLYLIKKYPKVFGLINNVAKKVALGSFRVLRKSLFLLGSVSKRVATSSFELLKKALFSARIGIKKFALGALGLLRRSLLSVGRAIAVLGRAFLLNPIGLAVTAIAASAFLIYKYWSPIKQFFANLWNSIKNIFSSVFQNITNLISGFASIWKGIGGFLIDGLIGGIVEKITAVKDTVVNVAKSIGGWFKSILGINSPSTVFAGFGKNITQGLTQGIDEGSNEAVESIKSIADGMGIDANSNSNKSISPTNATGALAGNSNNSSMVINYQPVINMGNNADSTAVKQALNMSLMEFEKMYNRMIAGRERRAF